MNSSIFFMGWVIREGQEQVQEEVAGAGGRCMCWSPSELK